MKPAVMIVAGAVAIGATLSLLRIKPVPNAPSIAVDAAKTAEQRPAAVSTGGERELSLAPARSPSPIERRAGLPPLQPPVSISELKNELRSLGDAELKRRVRKADWVIKHLHLVERANTIGLDAHEALTLETEVNRKAAAQALLIERTLAALESRPSWRR